MIQYYEGLQVVIELEFSLATKIKRSSSSLLTRVCLYYLHAYREFY